LGPLPEHIIMKKSALPAALLLLGVFISGCPVYDDDDVGCFSDLDCPYGYVCDGRGDICVAATPIDSSIACSRPSDCGTNETCSRSGICSTGDCHFSSVGCVRGYECSSESGRWECVQVGGSGEGGHDAGGAASAGGEPSISNGGGMSEAGATSTAGATGDAGATSGGMPSAAGNGG
jgi:hypothetical protein